MKFEVNVILYSLILFLISCHHEKPKKSFIPTIPPSQTTPPFHGTIFLDPDIIRSSDPSTFINLSYVGTEERIMFDRRENDWVTLTPFLFNANYDDDLSIEIQINPEFQNTDEAKIQALKYAEVIGRLPTALRLDVETAWIHKGTELFGGGNNNLLIHTGQSTLYENDGILEETLVHEASHSSLDAYHSATKGWVSAQELDATFISTYARDFPTREDVAETFLLYVAVRYRADRITPSLKDKIIETIPNRIDYLDRQNFNMYPFE